MPVIYLDTFIQASPRLVFNLSRSIDLHKESMTRHREEVVEGRKQACWKKASQLHGRQTTCLPPGH